MPETLIQSGNLVAWSCSVITIILGKEKLIMKTRISIMFVVLAIVSIVLTGCATGGMFLSGNVTDVQLNKSNFKIVARDISGEAQAGYLFGASMSVGMTTNTFALIRIAGSGLLYKEALQNLWKNYEAANGAIEGKKVALVNVRYDAEALNLFVYTQPRIIVRADVVEFTE